MRSIKSVVLHCSDSDIVDHDNVETIRKWHVEERGWSNVGYHFIIVRDGQVFPGRSVEKIGAHAKGHNKYSIGICLTGRNKFTDMQFSSLYGLLNRLFMLYNLEWKDVVLHNELDKAKTCPNFTIKDLLTRS